MISEELLGCVREADKYISKRKPDSDVEKRILARTVKLMEESGEVGDAVLSFLNDQRNEKLEARENLRKELEEEMADVILVTLLIAHASGCDVNAGLKRKIEKLKKR